MAITAKRTTSDFAPHPEGGPFPAVLARVALHEGVETMYGVKDRVQLTFQTGVKMADHVDGIDDDRPFEISVFATNSLNRKSRLLELIQVHIPTKQLDERLRGGKELDIEPVLVGTQWLLQVEHVERDGTKYSNVVNAMKAPDGQALAIWDRDEGWLTGVPF